MLKPRLGWIALIVLGVELTTGAMLLRARPTQATPATAKDVASTESSIRERLIGTWHDNYRAKRTLTIRPDGTATMICELHGMHRLFATQLLFEQEWSLEGDQLTLHTLRGEPQKKIDFVVKLKGDVARQRVLEATDSLLRVYDTGEDAEFRWERSSESSSGSAELLAQTEQ